VIFALSDPMNPDVSVFTQTMDHLLPGPLAYLGTLIGIAVLMSASAASAQGLQNLALGLKERQYLPPVLGQPNQYEVADKPVWIEVAIVSVCFFFFGTHEETYLALYAAGVFILLSMTGWAVTKRLVRSAREKFSWSNAFLTLGSITAALLTSISTLIIFEERFLEGAWTYLLFIPVIYAAFTYVRNRIGEPNPEMDYLGQLDAAHLAGFGFGQVPAKSARAGLSANGLVEVTWQPDPREQSKWREQTVTIHSIAVLLDGSKAAAQAIPLAKVLARSMSARVTLLSAIKEPVTRQQKKTHSIVMQERIAYLKRTANEFLRDGVETISVVRNGSISEVTKQYVDENGIDLVVTTTRGKSGKPHWLNGGVSRKLVQMIDVPILIVKYREQAYSSIPAIRHILVALDGSISSERTLPYARALAKACNSELHLLSVPAVPDVQDYRAPAEIVDKIRRKAETNMRKFLLAVARPLRKDRLRVRTLVKGSIPDHTIVAVTEEVGADMIMLTSRGRGSLDLLLMGSVADNVVQKTTVPVFMIPIPNETDQKRDAPDFVR
jgi:nucleotide-binding universal stress UspA family protein